MLSWKLNISSYDGSKRIDHTQCIRSRFLNNNISHGKILHLQDNKIYSVMHDSGDNVEINEALISKGLHCHYNGAEEQICRSL